MAKSANAVCEVLPPLPSGSIEVDALVAAIKSGASGEEAIAAATASPAAAPAPASNPAPESEPETPSEAPEGD